MTVAADPPRAPAEIYRARLTELGALADRLAWRDAAIAWGRLIVFLAGAVLVYFVFGHDGTATSWLLVPTAIFVLLVLVHDRAIRTRRRAQQTAQLYQDGLGRIEDRWPAGDGASARFSDAQHPYAADLDLFGAGSLFERLSTARTSMGQATLAAWLKAPATPSEIRGRQQAIDELRPRLELREDLAVLGMETDAEIHPQALSAWAAEPAQAPTRVPLGLPAVRIISAVLGLATSATLVMWAFFHMGLWPFVAAVAIAAAWVRALRPLVEPILAAVHRRAGELTTLALILRRLERERFQTPALAALRADLDTRTNDAGRGLPPSRRIADLARRVTLLDVRRNQLMALLVAPALWTTQAALAIESWRRAHGHAIARWLAVVGEIEALASLATYAFEHPELPFAEIADGDPQFDAESLSHPLLPAATRVANDVALGGHLDGRPRPRLLLVSGSNMSGKSTLLRTVGVNAVLALAGAPVCAQRLTLSPVAIGATLRVNDSLQEGRSRFYSEITRLRLIVDLTTGPLPVMFLLDEVLSGTNSHDRRIGAEGVIRTLLARNAIGLATTHDLALADVAQALGDLAANVHFEDELAGNAIAFDYRMRPGVIKKSNALALMRAVGLDV
jgi:hypothetical protein